MSFIFSDMQDDVGDEMGLTYDSLQSLLRMDDLAPANPRDEGRSSVSSFRTNSTSKSSKKGRISEEEKRERKNERNAELRRRSKEEKNKMVQQNKQLTAKLNKIILQVTTHINDGTTSMTSLARDILQIIESNDVL
jgi:FtsZ-interacting cell division protein YlmF